MKMTTINVQMETTVNTGDFNNVKVQYGIQTEPNAGETTKAAFDRVKAFVEKELTTSAAEISDEWATLRKKRYGK
jgi:hypothetical protein